jgi:opacity protein-like surface antigen
MPYVTAGGAAAGLLANEGFNPTGASPHIWGWVAGGGMELMAVSHFSLRLEYLHTGFTNSVEASDIPGGFPGVPVINLKQRDIDIVRGGLTYYLGSDKGITAW